jgi:DNA-binding Xre family transcriptional regulator
MLAVLEMPTKRKAARNLNKRIRCNLRRFMDEENISQTDLAERTGLALSTIGMHYRDSLTRIDTVTAIVLCSEFKCQLCEMFEIIED